MCNQVGLPSFEEIVDKEIRKKKWVLAGQSLARELVVV